MRRRSFLGTGLVLGATLLMPSATAARQSSPPSGPFTLPPLPYAADALEPSIDARTMEIHHGRHHQSFVNTLNTAAASDPSLNQPVEALLARASTLSASVRNNAGGHYNHSVFWTMMAPAGQGGEPSPVLLRQIETDFGSLDAFKTQFNAAATGRFGSGWAWLIWADGKLAITSTPNQDNPLMDDVEQRGAPLLAVDVWEHAYYLKYQNRRADYLTAWWDVVNWDTVNRLFEKAGS